ncbi:MAG TPA: hypothetical protein VGQ93_08270, partial [Lysobacter sp.]|nr:hypothetical protein [Lysobacter sp.]
MRLPLLAVLLLLASCVPTARNTLSPEETLLSEAIAAAGGETALRRGQVLHWTGEATVFAGDRRIELGVDSTVAPF